MPTLAHLRWLPESGSIIRLNRWPSPDHQFQTHKRTAVRRLSREEVLMEALPHEQAEDYLAEAVLVVRHHLHESNAHRFWSG
jgi:hypothetical protein